MAAPRAHSFARVVFGSLALSLSLVFSGAWAAPPILDLTPLKSAGSDDGPLFTALGTEESGISFVNPIDTEHPLKRLYIAGLACGGVAVGDLNGDDRPDLFLTNGARPNRLYIQSDDTALHFEDATEASGIESSKDWSTGATLVDIDADGDLDIYLCHYDAPNQLWLNDGKGVFREDAASFGLAISDASLMASFCDSDLDGDLDCYLLTSDFKRAGGPPSESPVIGEGSSARLKPGFGKYYRLVELPDGRMGYANAGREDYLLRNEGPNAQGKARFQNVGKIFGIGGRGFGNSVTWWDYNNDGFPDIYVGNDFADPDRLYRNNGDGTFTDVIQQVAPHTPWFSMGADVGDLDGDGRIDLLIADMAGTNHYRSKTTMGEIGDIRTFLVTARPRQYMHNALYLNTGIGKLSDGAFHAGLASSDWTWAVKLSDFDLDGRMDVFFSNGVARNFNSSDQPLPDKVTSDDWDYYESGPPRKEQNLAFRNMGDLRFDDVSAPWGLDHVGMSYSAATGDLDGDGDEEIIVASLEEPVRIYRNNAADEAKRLVVRLEGAAGNSKGLGARVTVKVDGLLQVKTLRPATGFMSCNLPELSFGLGEAVLIDELRVEWQRGSIQRFANLETGMAYTIREPREADVPSRPPSDNRPLFSRITSSSLGGIPHVERPFDDYARQQLLPYQHSLLGPGLAWGDIDKDGDPDAFLSGAAGSAGRILRNEGRGAFRPLALPALEADAEAEDLGALLLDFDRDGHLDLYVVSGGVECEPGDVILRDRLYRGDGAGGFEPCGEGALPDLRDSGSCAVAADYDRDGDLDLFIGGRVIPGAYPEAPSSHLLRNDSVMGNPKFTEQTSGVVGLEKAGLVTAALWSDANGDGWIDLLVCCEWGPVRLFLNHEGHLVEETKRVGLAEHLGWWSGIAGADLDGDGDIDYVVTNQGLNTPYRATREKPELIHYGDFDGSGKKHILEAKFEGETCYPRRGFSCSSLAMPGLRAKLGTFHQYASSTLDDLYGKSRVEGSLKLQANTLASGVLINAGDVGFRFEPLPREVQMSPARGVFLSDLNADGLVDCVVGQNFGGAQPEIGLHDSGVSLVLLGQGNGRFSAIPPTQSGITVAGVASSVTAADLNRDGQPELAFAVNSAPLTLYSDPRARDKEVLEVRLSGPAGNAAGIGSRVTIRAAGSDLVQTAEMTAGSGYLGQSESALWFGIGKTDATTKLSVEVRWPDGHIQEQEFERIVRRVNIERQ